MQPHSRKHSSSQSIMWAHNATMFRSHSVGSEQDEFMFLGEFWRGSWLDVRPMLVQRGPSSSGMMLDGALFEGSSLPSPSRFPNPKPFF